MSCSLPLQFVQAQSTMYALLRMHLPWAFSMCSEKKVCHNKGVQFELSLIFWSTLIQLPASSKWPFDSPNGGHVFSPEEITYGSKPGHDLNPVYCNKTCDFPTWKYDHMLCLVYMIVDSRVVSTGLSWICWCCVAAGGSGERDLGATQHGVIDLCKPKICDLTTSWINPSKIEWDLTNRPLSKLLELWDTQV